MKHYVFGGVFMSASRSTACPSAPSVSLAPIFSTVSRNRSNCGFSSGGLGLGAGIMTPFAIGLLFENSRRLYQAILSGWLFLRHQCPRCLSPLSLYQAIKNLSTGFLIASAQGSTRNTRALRMQECLDAYMRLASYLLWLEDRIAGLLRRSPWKDAP